MGLTKVMTAKSRDSISSASRNRMGKLLQSRAHRPAVILTDVAHWTTRHPGMGAIEEPAVALGEPSQNKDHRHLWRSTLRSGVRQGSSALRGAPRTRGLDRRLRCGWLPVMRSMSALLRSQENRSATAAARCARCRVIRHPQREAVQRPDVYAGEHESVE
jgi:hypothetical protein